MQMPSREKIHLFSGLAHRLSSSFSLISLAFVCSGRTEFVFRSGNDAFYELIILYQRLHRFWWRTLETVCLDDKFKMLLTDLRCFWSILYIGEIQIWFQNLPKVSIFCKILRSSCKRPKIVQKFEIFGKFWNKIWVSPM